MEINISRNGLIKPLGQVAGVVERRQSLPILAYALIRQTKNKLEITGTDLEVEVMVSIKTGGDPGEMTAPARKLLDICRGLPEDAQIKITQKDEKTIVRSGKSRFTLMALPGTDFPAIEAAEWNETFEVPQKKLKTLIENTQFCMAHQDVRYYLNGLLWDMDGKNLKAIATDGHRLASSSLGVPVKTDSPRQIIIPRKGIVELNRFLEESDDMATVSVGPNHLRVAMPQLTMISKLIDGRFPDYNKVIPDRQNVEILINRQQFHDALSRAAILSNEKYRGARLTLAPGNLTINAHNPEQEEAEEEIAIDYAGETIEIGFNVNYIIEATGALHGEQIKLGLNDANSSCTLTSPESKDTLYVIMPMRL